MYKTTFFQIKESRVETITRTGSEVKHRTCMKQPTAQLHYALTVIEDTKSQTQLKLTYFTL